MTFVDVLPHGICPTIEVTFDWQNDPTSATQQWTDITPYLVSYSRNPVRKNEFDQPGPATATLVLRNDDARFLPDNLSGPYYGGLKKYRRFRVRAGWAGVVYRRFWGYCLDWPQSWAQLGKDSTVVLQLVDALTALLTYDLRGQSFSSELSGQAISDVLTSAGTVGMGGAPVLDGGFSTIAASGVLPVNSFALQRIKDIAASENGLVFADGQGRANFHDRHHRLLDTRSQVVQATIGDEFGEIPYDMPMPMLGDAWSTVQVTPAGGSPVAATNEAAAASYFNQTLNFPPSGQYLVADANEALSAAQYLSNRYAEPVTRVPSIDLVGAQSPALWPTILGLDTSDIVKFRRRYETDQLMELEQFVEGYGDNVTVGKDWRVSLALSSTDPQKYWIAGDARLGLAGETTRGGY